MSDNRVDELLKTKDLIAIAREFERENDRLRAVVRVADEYDKAKTAYDEAMLTGIIGGESDDLLMAHGALRNAVQAWRAQEAAVARTPTKSGDFEAKLEEVEQRIKDGAKRTSGRIV